jgi:undecaprenyl-diphosphatase
MLESIILGVVQAVSEFLPISSSGHLRIAEYFLNFQIENKLSFEIALHFGTFLATVLIFFKDIKNAIIAFFKGITTYKKSIKEDKDFRVSIMVIVASIPTAIAGLLLKDNIESIDLSRVGLNLIITGSILLLTKKIDGYKVEEKKDEFSTTLKQVLIIGLAQSIAIFPGISRSGFTIAIALFLGLNREFAGRLSFLISLPAIFGAMLLTFKDFQQINIEMALVGLITAFIFGILALKFLLNFLKKGKLFYFGFYCIIVGLGVYIYFQGGI